MAKLRPVRTECCAKRPSSPELTPGSVPAMSTPSATRGGGSGASRAEGRQRGHVAQRAGRQADSASWRGGAAVLLLRGALLLQALACLAGMPAVAWGAWEDEDAFQDGMAVYPGRWWVGAGCSGPPCCSRMGWRCTQVGGGWVQAVAAPCAVPGWDGGVPR